VDSRYFPESIKRFNKLLCDMETALSEDPWLAGKKFSVADIGYAPYITRLDHPAPVPVGQTAAHPRLVRAPPPILRSTFLDWHISAMTGKISSE
jgi:glutathione S-transferase